MDDKDFSLQLKQLNRRHDLIAVRIWDPVERTWPGSDSVAVEDAETGETVFFDARDAGKLQQELDRNNNDAAALCRSAQVDLVEIESGTEVLKPLIEFFALRRCRLHR